jgi:hypothetical protein
MTVRRSAIETGIPLYLIPHAIARQIHKQGEDVYHTSEKRVHLHHYNITVRTKSPKRELMPGRSRRSPSGHPKETNSYRASRDGDSGGAP